jgi:putative transcriptional regulator
VSKGTILFGKRLQEIRKAKGITQEELAQMVEVKETKTIRNWEHGVHGPHFHHLEKIAEVLDISMKDLFDFRGLPENP